MTYPVKWMHSAMTGAPVVDNQWGALIGLLDACLISGFNVQTCNSIAVASGVATATFGSGSHGFQVGQIIQIEDGGAWNGQYRVLTVSGSLITFTAPSGATALATTCTVKTPGLGWTKPYSGTNKAAYKSADPTSSGCYLRVDNSLDPAYTTTYAKYAKVTLCESMTDIDTMVGARVPFDPANPTKNEVASGSGNTVINGWFKWYQAKGGRSEVVGDGGSSARQWLLVGDGKTFYLMINPYTGNNGMAGYSFGDYERYGVIDPLNCLLMAHETYYSANIESTYWLGSNNGFAMANTSVGRGVPLGPASSHLGFKSVFYSASELTDYVSGLNCGIIYPNLSDNSLRLSPVHIVDSQNSLRGQFRGLYFIPHTNCTLANLSIVENAGGKFLIAAGTAGSDQPLSRVAFSLTDWG